VLNYTPFGIRKDPVLAALSLFTFACAGMAQYRRSKLPADERFSADLELDASLPENPLDKALSILLLLSIAVSLAVLVYVIVTPKQGEKFTEFYILGPGGKAEDYPTNLRVGDTGRVLIGVVNHEYEDVNYTLRISLGNDSLDERGITLANNQTYSMDFSFVPAHNGTEKLSFDLYREGNNSGPYRSLHLWVKTSP